MSNAHDDRWLLPRRQTEVPTWDLLSETTLHGRREATYLVLAALVLVSTTALLALGVSRVIDPATVLGAIVPGIELPVAALIPIGAIPFGVGLAALTLVCELFGRRRATALVWVGVVMGLGVVALMRLGDLVDGGDAFGSSLALAACVVVANVGYVVIFDALRRRTRGRLLWPRLFGGALLPLALGWGAFGLALVAYGDHVGSAPARETVTAIAIGAGAWSVLCVIVLSIPIVIAVRALALYLRVGRIEELDEDEDDAPPIEPAFTAPPKRPAAERPELAQGSVAAPRPMKPQPAVIVEDDDADDEPIVLQPRRAPRNTLQVDSSAEIKFFADGDRLEAGD